MTPGGVEDDHPGRFYVCNSGLINLAFTSSALQLTKSVLL
jgi:hypothetical protein